LPVIGYLGLGLGAQSADDDYKTSPFRSSGA
jgi:hypothetical protein